VTVWSWLRLTIALWLIRKALKITAWLLLALIVVAAWPVTLTADACYLAAWLRGWPAIRLYRTAAWTLPVTAAWRAFAGDGLPRDGGMADLLAEAASLAPKFAAVVCEDIERSGRDVFNALKLEKKLSRQGIALFATDEPAVIEGVNATTVLVRRMKQGVAEWFRLQLKEKTWKGLVEHALEGWNIGPAPYGYTAIRIQHPVPAKASQGRTKTRLALDPQRAPVVEQIFTWRVVHKLGMPTIAAKLNADPARYPSPTGKGWTTPAVWALLANPKYTGHMVYGRIRTRNGRRVTFPASEWLWTPEPVHPVIVDRDVWDAAQAVAADHRTSRDGTGLSRHPAATRAYPYRGRVRCRDSDLRQSVVVTTQSL
jgi:site-specific DNA recombinase